MKSVRYLDFTRISQAFAYFSNLGDKDALPVKSEKKNLTNWVIDITFICKSMHCHS